MRRKLFSAKSFLNRSSVVIYLHWQESNAFWTATNRPVKEHFIGDYKTLIFHAKCQNKRSSGANCLGLFLFIAQKS